MIFYKDRSYQLNIECKPNFVIDFWGGENIINDTILMIDLIK